MSFVPSPPSVAASVRRRIERCGERVWRFDDFPELSFEAVAQALSRLTRQGVIERIGKGIYYRHRETASGKRRLSRAAIRKLVARQSALFPAGIAAANLLGFTNQSNRPGGVYISRTSLPRNLLGKETVLHSRRPEAWRRLSETDAALLEFLRGHARSSKLRPRATMRKTVEILSEEGRFERLLKVMATEPPRVRAMFGAIGEELGKSPQALKRLRKSLNPFSRYDFGALAGLPYARKWQAEERD